MIRHLILLLLFINFSTRVSCQIITGTVLDKSTGNAIQHAIVYFNGTFNGTYTDQKGNFELDISKNNMMPLTISALGYYSATNNDFEDSEPLLIYLSPKVYELNEVVISAKRSARSRRENLRLFKAIFLGTTQNASRCEIINEKDIVLFNDNDTLKAYSLQPILIDNKALGYNISYYLDRFTFLGKNNVYVFTGNIIFNEDLITNDIQKWIIERRRRNAYFGSKMHFFRSLWSNDLDSVGFSVTGMANVKLNYNDIVIQKDDPSKDVPIKYLKYKGILGISYNAEYPTSYISFTKEYIYFFSNGNFDGLGITWEGKMASQRIADLLPYEYSVE